MTKLNRVAMKDTEGLGTQDKIPFVCFDVPEEFAKVIKHMRPIWYESDGNRVFEVRDEQNKVIGYRAYILFGI